MDFGLAKFNVCWRAALVLNSEPRLVFQDGFWGQMDQMISVIEVPQICKIEFRKVSLGAHWFPQKPVGINVKEFRNATICSR
jgi:hypothetical protein